MSTHNTESKLDFPERSIEISSPPAAMFKRDLRPVLVFLNGDLMAVPIPLERETVTLGRALEADIRVNDSRVSRLHAQIFTEQNAATGEIKCILRDLNSKNGTLLNGQSVSEAVLNHGDKISIGSQLLRFDLLDEIDRQFQQQIHRLLMHDELTGLLSSRSFFSELRREAGRAEAENRPFCVLMMDIDNFKAVNDSFGHLTGSRTIAQTGECIMRCLRSGDAAARFGGEEFAAFLLDADLRQGVIAAERIRKMIEQFDFEITRMAEEHTGDSFHRITISVGVASFPEDSRDPIQLIEMADAALYRAKRAGRNRSAAYRQLTPEDFAAPLLNDKR